MKKVIAFILAAVLVLSLLAGLAGCADSGANNTTGANDASGAATTKYKVGICQLVRHDALDAATKGFRDAVVQGLGEENVEFIEQNAQGDTTTCTTIVTDLVNKKVDLIMANATPALQSAVNGTTTIPILGTSVTEYGVALDIKDFNGTVGGNVSGCSDLAPLDQTAQIILDMFPDAKKVGLIYCSAEANSAYQVKAVKDYLTGKGLTCTEYSFADANDVSVVAATAAAASDVLYVPTDNTAASCAETINNIVLPTGTPIVGGDTALCKGCGVATLSVDYYDLGVATGKMAVDILTGKANISEMPIGYADPLKVYNAENCKALNIDTKKLEDAGFTAIAD